MEGQDRDPHLKVEYFMVWTLSRICRKLCRSSDISLSEACDGGNRSPVKDFLVSKTKGCWERSTKFATKLTTKFMIKSANRNLKGLMFKKSFAVVATLLAWASLGFAQEQTGTWRPLFDGQTLKGWKAGENPASFKVVDGQIACDGPRAHLFYIGDGQADFKNFGLKVDVMSRPGANSGVYFHTSFQDQGWPDQGFEVQVDNTQPRHGNYLELKRPAACTDSQPIQSHRQGQRVVPNACPGEGQACPVWVNEVLLVDYVEPREAVVPSSLPNRRLSHGTFALQGHDPESKAFFKNILVKRLPDDAQDNVEAPVVDDSYRQILELEAANFPVVNSHVHLKGGLSIEDALRLSRQTGIGYGIAVNCGVGFAVTNDAGINAYLESMKSQPVYIAMQAEGREWVKMFSKEAIAKFDYVFTDSMTFTDDNGRRMRL